MLYRAMCDYEGDRWQCREMGGYLVGWVVMREMGGHVRLMGGYVGRWVAMKGDDWLCREIGSYAERRVAINS